MDTVCCGRCCLACIENEGCLDACDCSGDDFDADELGLDPEEEYDA